MVTSPAYPSFLYAAILTVSYWCWILFEIYLILRDRGAAKSDSQDRGTRSWNIISIAIGIVLGIFSVPYLVPQLAIRDNITAFFTFGITLVWAGILFRFWAVRTLGKFFRTKVIIQEEHMLVSTGPYRYLRHPSYTGILITLLGFGFGVGNWLSLIVLLVAGFVAFERRISVEDAALAERFGKEYEEYRKRRKALIPFIW
jgi:protein-S-isoprenylcysteine O-methyltransferase